VVVGVGGVLGGPHPWVQRAWGVLAGLCSALGVSVPSRGGCGVVWGCLYWVLDANMPEDALVELA